MHTDEAILPELQETFYKQELMSFFESFVVPGDTQKTGNYPNTVPFHVKDVLADVEEIFKTDGFLSPDKLRERLTEKYVGGSSPELQSILSEVDRSTYTTDHMTEFLQKPQLGTISGLGHLYAQTTNTPITMVEVDYSNMGGTNDFHQIKILEQSENPHAKDLIEVIKQKALNPQKFEALFSQRDLRSQEMVTLFKETQTPAFELTDDTAKLIALTIEQEISHIIPEGGRILPVRAGGDELRLIVVGINPDDYSKIVPQIHSKIEEHMAQLGLHDHAHLKRPNDPLSNGFGAAIAIVDMRSIDPATAVQNADNEIKDQKTIMGRYRLGEIDETSLGIEFTEIFQDPSARPEGEHQSIDSAVNQAIEEARYISKQRQAYFASLKTDNGPSLEQREIYLVQENIEMISCRTTPVEASAPDFLQNITVEGDPFSTPSERKEKAILSELERKGVELENDYQYSLVHAYACRTTPTDPSSGAWMPNDMPAMVEIYANDSQKLELSPYTVSVAFHNLGGLNDVLGHDGANVVLREMHEGVILNALESEGFQAGDYQIAHYGGAEFHMVLKPQIETSEGPRDIDPQVVLQIEEKIIENTQALSKEDIFKYLEKNGVHQSKEDKKNLRNSGIHTFGDIRDIKVERNINGIGVVTYSSKVNLNDKTAGYHLQQKREKLSECVSEFRHECASIPPRDHLDVLYDKMPDVNQMEPHLGNLSAEFKSLVFLKDMVNNLDKQLHDLTPKSEGFDVLNEMKNRYRSDFNDQATTHGAEELLIQAGHFADNDSKPASIIQATQSSRMK